MKSKWLPTFPLHAANWLADPRVQMLSPVNKSLLLEHLLRSWMLGKAVAVPAGIAEAYADLWPEYEAVLREHTALREKRAELGKRGNDKRWGSQKGSQLRSPGDEPAAIANESQGIHRTPTPTIKTPSESLENPSDSLPQKRGADTWLTPFGKAWERATKGVFHYKKAASFLASLREKHGDEKALAAWVAYLNATPVDKLSVPRFAETFGAWSGDAPPPPPRVDERRRDNRNSLAPVESRQNVPSYEETRRRIQQEDEEQRRMVLLRQAREAAGA